MADLRNISSRMSLSVVIITKNEETVIEDSLKSAAWADEIIILDSGSTDRTCEIGRCYGAKIYENTEWKGFGIQRQIAQEYAQGDYIFMLDADERVSEKLRQSILLVLENPDDSVVYCCKRNMVFLERTLHYTDVCVRLYSRKNFKYDSRLVHEQLERHGAKIKFVAGNLLHDTCRDLPSFQQKQLRYATDWAIANCRKGKEVLLITPFLSAFLAFFRTYFLKKCILDGWPGLVLAVVNSVYAFNKKMNLWIFNRQNNATVLK